LLSDDVRVLGLDAEFAPRFCSSDSSQKIAILQISMFDVVFVFDMLLPLTESRRQLFAELFSSKRILKLGE
jgi:hypothetical protein